MPVWGLRGSLRGRLKGQEKVNVFSSIQLEAPAARQHDFLAFLDALSDDCRFYVC
jgi:hypothetical protein